MTTRATLLGWVLVLQSVGAVHAQDSGQPDDALGFGSDEPAAISGSGDDALGFGAQPAASASAPKLPFADEPSPFQLSGSLRLQSAVRAETDQPHRLARMRQVTDLRVEWKERLGDARLRALAAIHTEVDFAYLANMQSYDRATLDSAAWLARPGETYLSLAWPALELSAGYQIVNLGQGEMISLFDLVNPRDLREPLAVDPGDLRLPILASRMGLSVGPLRAEVIAVHEAYFGLLPPPLGEWSPFRKLLLESSSVGDAFAGRTLFNRHEPGRDLKNIRALQVYGRATLSLSSVDLALVSGSTLDRMGVPILSDPAALAGMNVELTLLHSRYTFLGHSGAGTIGPIVLRWEIGVDLTRPLAFQRTDTEILRWQMERRHVVSGMLGFTYSPSLATSAALEVVQSYVHDNPTKDPRSNLRLLFPVEATQLAFRFNHRFWKDRASLGLILLWVGVHPVNAWTARAELGYALSDRLEATFGYVTYQPTRQFGYMYGLDRNDRVFLNLRWELGT